MSDEIVGDRKGSESVGEKKDIVTTGAADVASVPPPPASTDLPGSDGSWARRWATRLMILALVASLFYLLAERNRRFYFLSTEGETLVVSRGTWLPSWKAPYHPEDPLMEKAYAPIDIPEGEHVAQRRFDERQDLDQALFEILIEWAQVRILADEPESLSLGTDYLERAALLPGISGEQFTRIRALRAEVAFSEGRSRLVEALSILDSVNERLALAASGRTARARRAQGLLQVMVPATEALTDALQQMRAEPGSKAADLRGPKRQAPGEGAGASGSDGSERKEEEKAPATPAAHRRPGRERVRPVLKEAPSRVDGTATEERPLPRDVGERAASDGADPRPAGDRGEAAPKDLAHEDGVLE